MVSIQFINMIGGILIIVLSVLFLIITVLPFVKSDYWTFRMLEYPRMQKMIIGLIILAGAVAARIYIYDWFWWIIIPLAISIIYQAVKIFPYTPFAALEMKQVKEVNKSACLKIFTANVLLDNDAYHKMLEQIKSQNPDVIFLVETGKKWEQAMAVLESEYSYQLKHPLENTYGLLFYSRYKIIESKLQCRVQDDVPSVEATVLLPNNIPVKIFGLHPKPPVPEENLYSTAKDKELMKIALELENFEDPCVVMGDLNDVAWSYVTKLFRKVSGLIDPRRGRGFYSTFSANHWWMRFPLDYIFCSSHFGLIDMRRLPHNGSDHFAMSITLQYTHELKQTQEKPHADEDEKEAAVEKANTTEEK
jgi:endonuclease/exonuclease/phosphatase (EEP) superfamily protein YafD